MKIRNKRIVSCALALVMVCSWSIPVMATEEIYLNSEKQIIANFVSEALPFLLGQNADAVMQNFETNSALIGEKLNVYRAAEAGIVSVDYEVYPISVNNQLAGLANVAKNEMNEAVISCNIDYAPALQLFLSDNPNVEFALVYAQDGLYAVTETDSPYLLKIVQNIGDTISIINVNFTTESIDYADITAAELLSFPSMSTYALQYNTVPVPYIANGSTSCCPNGICWAASIASITNYYRGTTYSALQVHNICGCLLSGNYHQQELGYLSDFGLYTGGEYTSNLTYDVLRGYVDSNAVALLDLQSYSYGIAHNVVAYGYNYDGSGGAKSFYYMDPNVGFSITSFPASGTVYVIADSVPYGVHCYIKAY